MIYIYSEGFGHFQNKIFIMYIFNYFSSIKSCAWRHCGAQADAQESLAELYNSIGLFEPFECLFTIDIVERSLRDIVNVVPIKYHSKEDIQNLQPYVKYKSQQEINLENGFSDNDDGMDSSDVDYLNILNGLRSSNDDSDE